MRKFLVFIFLAFLLAAPQRLVAEELYFYHLEEEALSRINDFRASLPELEEKSPCLTVSQWSPLELSEPLNLAAQEFLRRAVAEMAFSHLLPDGSYPKSRVEEQGYPALFVGESLAYLGFENYLPPEEALEIVLNWLLENAPKQQGFPESAPFVFPAYRHFGMAMAGVTISIEGQAYNFYLFCFLFAVPGGEEGSFVLGRFYDDQDQNGVFTPQEGIEGVRVRFSSLEGESLFETCTLSDGSFFLPISTPGLLDLEVEEVPSWPRLELFSSLPIFVHAPAPKFWLNLASGGQN